MDFLMIGSLNSYIKNIGMQNKWQRKKDQNDFTPDDTLNETQRKNEQFKKTYMEQKENDKTDETLSAINSKIAAGSKLTPDEMKYLQVKNPTLYQKLKNIEKEKKQYERELKQCKTKDDVQKLKMSKISASLSTINSVKNNPNIPEGKKLEVATGEMKRLSELEKIAAKFVKSGEYKNLPTEAERRKAEHDIKEAEELEKNSGKNVNNADNNDEKECKFENTLNSENTDNEEKNTVADNKLTKLEAEQTPEAKKLKRSKAKSAYLKSVSDNTDESYIIYKG